jgi:hypothetical protein
MINNLRSKQKKVVDIVSLKEHSLISMRARYTLLDHIILGVRSAETGREYHSLRELGYFR